MFKRNTIALAVTAALACSPLARAATDDDLKEIREQVRQMKEQYEKRIDALEKRLQQAEQSAGKAEATAGKAETAAVNAEATAGKAQVAAQQVVSNQAAVQASSRPVGENAMNPGISLILNATYGNTSQDPSAYKINGFVPTGGEVSPSSKGLSLGETELVIAGNIDPNFRGNFTAALGGDNTIGVEEAYIQTLGLSHGLTVKAGRFLASMGYLNQVHSHGWDFTDMPLANKVFLGNQFIDDGIQLKWVAPTELYFDLGMELGRGRAFPGGPSGGRNKNGFSQGTLFAHLGGDIGASTAWQVGLSAMATRPQSRTYTDPDSTGTSVTNSIDGNGNTRLSVLDGVLKWSPNGNATSTNFKLQGEYFRLNESGQLTYDTKSESQGMKTASYSSRQSGWYAQGVYQFMPQWRVGYRYDQLNSGTLGLGLVDSGALSAADFPILGKYDPKRQTLIADWSPSEFSRFRLQFARDYARQNLTDNQVYLQYIVSLGAHGAHKF